MNIQPVVVIAPDKFKGSATAKEVAAALTRGLRSATSSAEVRCVPVADGGEGTIDAAVAAGFTQQTALVTGPLGRPVEARWAIKHSSDRTDAVVELAQTSGIELLEPTRSTGATATSRGTGELLQAALEAGATRIVLGLGGSACTDGGAGMLAALGAKLLDQNGITVADGGGSLHKLHRIELTDIDPRWAHTEVILASDVDNPLLGIDGAARVFGPQKGLSDDDIAGFDTSLGHFAERLRDAAAQTFGREAAQSVTDAITKPGAGAAGGTGFAAMAVLGAKRRRGIDVILDIVDFASALTDATLVITGEGSLDVQTLQGKAPVGIAQVANQHQIPVFAVCGRSLLSDRQAAGAGFDRVFALTELESDPEVSMREAQDLLVRLGARIGKILLAHSV